MHQHFVGLGLQLFVGCKYVYGIVDEVTHRDAYRDVGQLGADIYHVGEQFGRFQDAFLLNFLFRNKLIMP